MKTLLQKFLCVVMLAVATLFVACEPEYVQKDEVVDPSDIEFHAPDFKIVVKSKRCSEILLSAGSDGSMTYLDGAKISELGHWLMYDDPEIIGDEGYDNDTLFASFNPPSKALSVEWEISDPSVLEIVAQSVEDGYIVVKAKKIGTTDITASCEDRKTTIHSTVTDYYVTKMEGWDSNAKAGYLVENHTIFLDSDDPNSKRLNQKVWMVLEQKPAEVKSLIKWTPSEEGIVELKIKEGGQNNDKTWQPDSCIISPIKEGMISVIAQCQYRTVEVIITVKAKQAFTPIDSLQIVDNNGVNLRKLWLSRGEMSLAKVLCWPDNAYVDYDGYKWRSLNEDIVSIAQSGGDDLYNIKGLKKGTGKVMVSLGAGNSMKADTVEVEVCHAITQSDVKISAPAGIDLMSINVGETVQFTADISYDDATFNYYTIEWYCDAPVEQAIIDKSTGELTAIAQSSSFNVWAEVEYEKYPGREGNDEISRIVVSGNRCRIVEQVNINVDFTPVSITSAEDDYGQTVPMFVDAAGNTLLYLPNDAFIEIAGDGSYDSGEVELGTDYTLVYKSSAGTYTFNSGTCSLKIENGEGVYSFADVKAIGGAGAGKDVYLRITPANGTLTYTPQ